MARQIVTELFIMIVLGVLLGVLGPFGSFALSAPERILYWVSWIVAGYLLFRPTGVVAHWFCDQTGLPRIVGTGLAILIAAFPLTVLVSMMAQNMQFTEVLRWPGFWWMYGYIWVVALVVSGLTNAIFHFGRVEQNRNVTAGGPATTAMDVAAEASESGQSPAPAALALPLGFGPISALKGEDHYVRFFGEGKTHLALMRLRDAMAMMPDDAGLQVHRSWWVAKNAVASASRDGRGAILTLHDGTSVPVARDKMAEVRAAGWL